MSTGKRFVNVRISRSVAVLFAAALIAECSSTGHASASRQIRETSLCQENCGSNAEYEEAGNPGVPCYCKADCLRWDDCCTGFKEVCTVQTTTPPTTITTTTTRTRTTRTATTQTTVTTSTLLTTSTSTSTSTSTTTEATTAASTATTATDTYRAPADPTNSTVDDSTNDEDDGWMQPVTAPMPGDDNEPQTPTVFPLDDDVDDSPVIIFTPPTLPPRIPSGAPTAASTASPTTINSATSPQSNATRGSTIVVPTTSSRKLAPIIVGILCAVCAVAFLALACFRRDSKEEEAPKETHLETIALSTMRSKGQLPSTQARTDSLRRVVSTETIVPMRPNLSDDGAAEDEVAAEDKCLGCGGDGEGRVDPDDDKFYCNVCWDSFAADPLNVPVAEEDVAVGGDEPLPPSPSRDEAHEHSGNGDADKKVATTAAEENEPNGDGGEGGGGEEGGEGSGGGEEGAGSTDHVGEGEGEEIASAGHNITSPFGGLPTGDLDQQAEVVIDVNEPPPVVVPAAANFALLMSVQSDVTAGKDTGGDKTDKPEAGATSATVGGGYLTLGAVDIDSGSGSDEDSEEQQDGLDDVDTTTLFDALPGATNDGSTVGGGYLGIEAASDGSGSDEEPLPGEPRNRNSHMASMASALGGGDRISGKGRPESTLSTNLDFEGLAAVKTPGSTMAGGISLGARVSIEGYDCQGTVRFIGPHHDPTKGARVLVELDLPVGKNNGTVGGHVYGAVAAKCGVLVAPSKVYKGMPGRRVTKRQKPKKRRSTKRVKPKTNGGGPDDDFDEDPLGLGDEEFDDVEAMLVQAPARSRHSHLLSMSKHAKGGTTLETEMDDDDDDIDLDNVDLESPTREKYDGFASMSPDFAAEGDYGFGGGDISFVDGVSGAGPVEEEFGFDTEGDPKMHAWYVEDMSHDDCSKLVLASSTGDFLVRSMEEKHVLCINDHQRLKVVNINKTGRGTECELNGTRFADLGVVLDSLQRDPLLSVRGMPLNLASAASNSA